MSLKLLHGDAVTELTKLESESIDCCITSPPYWNLRDYKTEGQIGLEPTIGEYIDKLIAIFSQVKRVLKKSGSCWVVMGDTYAGNWNRGSKRTPEQYLKSSTLASGNKNQCYKSDRLPNMIFKSEVISEKSLCMIPSRFAIAMIDNGWILRNDIIWHKPNCMPSSAKDRFTVDYEHIFFFTKSKKYYFETQYERIQQSSIERARYDFVTDNTKYNKLRPDTAVGNLRNGSNPISESGRIKRSVWKIPTQAYAQAHFAVYPEKLIEIPVKTTCPIFICDKCERARRVVYNTVSTPAGGSSRHFRADGSYYSVGGNKYTKAGLRSGNKCLPAPLESVKYVDCGCNAGFHGGTVLDPFMGSGTTGLVAAKNARNFVGIELNADYIKLAEKRLEPYIKQEKLIFSK